MLVDHEPQYIIQKISEHDYLNNYGVLITPGTFRKPDKTLTHNVMWSIDNFAFTKFPENKFKKLLETYKEFSHLCSWVTSPDTFADYPSTLKRFYQWSQYINHMGYKRAIVIQNNAHKYKIPYDDLDCVFVGCSDEYKFSHYVLDIVQECKSRNIVTHMGRVNSIKRIKWCFENGFDTVDGSSYARFPDKNIKANEILRSLNCLTF